MIIFVIIYIRRRRGLPRPLDSGAANDRKREGFRMPAPARAIDLVQWAGVGTPPMMEPAGKAASSWPSMEIWCGSSVGGGWSSQDRWIARKCRGLAVAHRCRNCAPRREGLNFYAARYFVTPNHASAPPPIKKTGDHCRTSAILKNAIKVRINIQPPAASRRNLTSDVRVGNSSSAEPAFRQTSAKENQ